MNGNQHRQTARTKEKGWAGGADVVRNVFTERFDDAPPGQSPMELGTFLEDVVLSEGKPANVEFSLGQRGCISSLFI